MSDNSDLSEAPDRSAKGPMPILPGSDETVFVDPDRLEQAMRRYGSSLEPAMKEFGKLIHLRKASGIEEVKKVLDSSGEFRRLKKHFDFRDPDSWAGMHNESRKLAKRSITLVLGHDKFALDDGFYIDVDGAKEDWPWLDMDPSYSAEEQLSWWNDLSQDELDFILREHGMAVLELKGLPRSIHDYVLHNMDMDEIQIRSLAAKANLEASFATVEVAAEVEAKTTLYGDGHVVLTLAVGVEVSEGLKIPGFEEKQGVGAGLELDFYFNSEAEAKACLSDLLQSISGSNPIQIAEQLNDFFERYPAMKSPADTRAKLDVFAAEKLNVGSVSEEVKAELSVEHSFAGNDTTVSASLEGSFEVSGIGLAAKIEGSLEVGLTFDNDLHPTEFNAKVEFEAEAGLRFMEDYLKSKGLEGQVDLPKLGAHVSMEFTVALEDSVLGDRVQELLQKYQETGVMDKSLLETIVDSGQVLIQVDSQISAGAEVGVEDVAKFGVSIEGRDTAFVFRKVSGQPMVRVNVPEVGS